MNFDTTGDRGVNQILPDKFEGKKKPAISAGFFRIWLPDRDLLRTKIIKYELPEKLHRKAA